VAAEPAEPTEPTEPEGTGENKAVKPDPVQSSFNDVVPGGVSASATRPARAEIAAAPPRIPAVPRVDAADNGLVDLTEAPEVPGATDPTEKPVVSEAPLEAPIEAPLVRDTVDNVETPVEPSVEPVEVATAAVIAKSRITVRAAGVSWIQIRDNAANELLVMKLLQRGQSYDVPNQKDLSMGTGNAGALVITVDGVEVPAVGPVGAVRRNILLDVDRLRNGTAVIK
jgi:cytoskeleton protein RodZ